MPEWTTRSLGKINFKIRGNVVSIIPTTASKQKIQLDARVRGCIPVFKETSKKFTHPG